MEQSYTITKVPKGNSYRVLYKPCDSYKNELKKLLPELLKIHKNLEAEQYVAHAFIPGRNCVTNASCHLGFNYTISIDLKDFFDSIAMEHVEQYLSTEIIEKCFIKGAPRQGLPTSPLIANIAMIDIDHLIISELSKHTSELSYTRYADDITISFNTSNMLNKAKFIATSILNSFGFTVNHRKTKFQSLLNGRIIITGVAVDKSGIHPTRKTLKKIRAAEHQKNYSSYTGLIDWSKCKLPNIHKKLNIDITLVTDKVSKCQFCGLDNLIWARLPNKSYRLYDLKNNRTHSCSKLRRSSVFPHLKSIGYNYQTINKKPWTDCFYSTGKNSTLILFRKNGLNIYTIDWIKIVGFPNNKIEYPYMEYRSDDCDYTDAEMINENEMYYKSDLGDLLLYEFIQEIDNDTIDNQVLIPSSQSLSLIYKGNYKDDKLHMHQLLLNINNTNELLYSLGIYLHGRADYFIEEN